MISLSKLRKEKQWNRIIVLLLLFLLLAIGAVPGYLTGRWEWKQPPPVTSLKELRQLLKTGLSVPGWQTIEQAETQIGARKASVQIIQQQDSKSSVILLLIPQNGPMVQPEVEWTEINGWGKSRWGKWDVAQYRSAEFTIKQSPKSGSNTQTKVEARFFRAFTGQQTFAVLEWYALPNDGHPSPWRWFLADQVAQLYKRRVPWVAVSIFIPMEFLGQVEATWPLARSIGETVQASLMAGPLTASK